MKKADDFGQDKLGVSMPSPAKTRITIMLDAELLEHFRAQALAKGLGYQTLINATLRESVASCAKRGSKSLTEATLRRVIREEVMGSRQDCATMRTDASVTDRLNAVYAGGSVDHELATVKSRKRITSTRP